MASIPPDNNNFVPVFSLQNEVLKLKDCAGTYNPSAASSLSYKEEIRKTKLGKTVTIEGNIGCGKTTFLNYFQKYKNVQVLEEPVAKWKDVMGFNALDLLYKDTNRWSCAFEFLATLSLVENHRAHKNHQGLKLIERSIYSTRHCFMEYLSQKGQIEAMDQVVLTDWHAWLDQNEDIDIDLIVYLRSSPEVCAERMKLRSRAEEADIPMDYLRALHQLHDDWLLHGKRGKLPAPLLEDIDRFSQEILFGLDSTAHELVLSSH